MYSKAPNIHILSTKTNENTTLTRKTNARLYEWFIFAAQE